ncbi:MAG TPA: hypothetical protein EYP65_02720, partial [Armatimonadetes bacterium]|nr:hypothetical protein [Armatimonadota bacterium]
MRVSPNALRLEGVERRKNSEEKRLILRLSGRSWRVKLTYTLPQRGVWVKVGASFEYAGEGRPRVEGVRFSIFRARVKPVKGCLYAVPGVWPPRFVKFTELQPGRSIGVGIGGATPTGIVHNI